MQRRACAQATKALIQLGKKFQWKKDCVNIFANTFFNETANDFTSRGVLNVICFVLTLATSH